MLFLVIFAWLAGIATVLSPCVLPVLPAILSASASGGRGRPAGVIIGLILSFVFFTLTLTALVHSFGISANLLRYAAIAIIGGFGVVLLFPSLSARFAKLSDSIADFGVSLQARARTQKTGFASGLLIGVALGLVWTPCAGPILAAITTLVATQQVSFQIFLLIVSYSLGAALPLLVIAYGGQKLFSIPSLAKYTEAIRSVFGLLMILTALALMFHLDVRFQEAILEYVPQIDIEQNPRVREELEKLRGNAPFEAIHEGAAENGVLPVIAKAPDFEGIAAWINSPPLTMESLKGKVVLIDFWTYSCINCIRTFPYLRHWYDAYKDQGFVIVGVHTPEFEFEKNEENVKKAVKRFDLTYPVAMDNRYQTWQAYHNYYWPAHYLIDQNGMIREVHFGEGGYAKTENDIRTLLNLPPLVKETAGKAPLGIEHLMGMTPETYLGYKRASSYAPGTQVIQGKPLYYQSSKPLNDDQVGLQGEWIVEGESIESNSDDALLELNFQANRVYLVLAGSSQEPIRVELDGKPVPAPYRTADMNAKGEIFVKDARKYDIVNLQGKDGRHLLTLNIPKGIQAFAFTFGMEN